MSNYSALKTDINNNIYENNTQQITGTVLNTVLKDMVNTLGAGYQFAGCAYLDLNPGAPDAKVFYLAGEGLYTNFDNIQVPAGKLGILKWDTRWRLETIEGLGGGGANLTGYISVASTDDLPDVGQPTIGYLCGTNLYLYVGEGGDTKEGKYQNCGGFRGPEGVGITEIEQVEQSTANGGRNTIRIHLSNGSSYDVYTRNGTTSTGLFPTLEALQAAYPSPVVGQYAFVGAGFPADIYVCNTAGTWTDSGADYDGDSVDLTDYATKAELNQLEAKVDKGNALPYTEMKEDVTLTGTRTNGGDFPLFSGVKYKITAKIDVAVSSYVAVSIRVVGDSTDMVSYSIAIGSLSKEFYIIPDADYLHCCFSVYTNVYSSVGDVHFSLSCDRGITQNILPGMSKQTPSSDAVSNLITKVGEFSFEELPVYTSASGWELLPNGLCASNSSAKLVKYQVSAGQILRLSLVKDTKSVYQFQNSASVPSSGNPNTVGDPVAFATDGIVIVPTGATYLVLSMLTSNTTSKVYKVSNSLAEQINVLKGQFSGVFDFGSGTIAQYAKRTLSYNVIAGHEYRVKINTQDTTNTTYFSTRTDIDHTVDNGLGSGIGTRTFDFTATGNAPLVALSYQNAGTGASYDVEIIDLTIPSVNKNHIDIETLFNMQGGAISLPDYSKAEQTRVYDILSSLSNGEVHISTFNTDQHFDLDYIGNEHPYNPKWVMQGVQALLNIANLLPLDSIVFGGDVAGPGGGTSSDAIGILQTVCYLLNPTHDVNSAVVSIPGNHDAWQNNGNVTAQGMYNVNAKRNQRHTYYIGNGTDNCDAYIDDTEHKIRSIFVDTFSRNTRTEDFREFLGDTLDSLPEGYMALIFSHNPLTNEFAGTVLAQKISDPSVEINAFQDPDDCHSILNTYADKIIACISGHTHFDASAVSSAGILYIETTTAAPHGRNYTTDNIPNTSTLNTVTDTSFDFFVIDKNAKTIEAVRYGQGCNRKWKYKGDDAGMLPGYPQTIVRS